MSNTHILFLTKMKRCSENLSQNYHLNSKLTPNLNFYKMFTIRKTPSSDETNAVVKAAIELKIDNTIILI
jgi:hypothetical protein